VGWVAGVSVGVSVHCELGSRGECGGERGGNSGQSGICARGGVSVGVSVEYTVGWVAFVRVEGG
jgi:hypothetical protein